METKEVDFPKENSKQSELKEAFSKKILFVLDYANNAAYREDVSHLNDNDVEDYVEENYG